MNENEEAEARLEFQTIAKKHLGSTKDKLSNLLLEVLETPAEEKGVPQFKKNPPGAIKFRIIFSFLVIVQILSGLTLPNLLDLDLQSFDTRRVLILLGFTVALASYIASAIRELLKIKGVNSRKSILYTSVADVSLVLLAVALIARIIFSPQTVIEGDDSLKLFTDENLVAYIISILAYMICLHVRAWMFYTKPWSIHVK